MLFMMIHAMLPLFSTGFDIFAPCDAKDRPDILYAIKRAADDAAARFAI